MDKHLKRQLELAGLLTENRKNVLPNVELIKDGNDGVTYAVIRENRKYFIKTAKTKENLTEQDFDFLHGLVNKGRNTFKSYEDATFKLNLIFEDINRTFGGGETNILENSKLDEKRYVLKQPKPKMKEPEMDFGDDGGSEEGGDEEFDFGGDEGDSGEEEFDFGGEEGSEEGGDEEFDFGSDDEPSIDGDEEIDLDGGDEFSDDGVETGDTIKDIQKLTGKLGQQIRDTEDLSSDMQKWVAKSVMSALKPETMGSSDKEDIINTINSGGEVDEVVLGYSKEPDTSDEHDYDPDLTGPGGPNWTFKHESDLKEDEEEALAIAKRHGDYQDGDDISAISGALAMDREMNEYDDDSDNLGGETYNDDELLFSSEEMYGNGSLEEELPKKGYEPKGGRPERRPKLRQEPNPPFEPERRPKLQQRDNPEYNPDPSMDPRTGRKRVIPQQKPNPSYDWSVSSMDPKDIESSRELNRREMEKRGLQQEDDGILKASDLYKDSDDDYHEPPEDLESSGGVPWGLPKHGNDPNMSRRGMYRESMSNKNQLDTYLELENIIREQSFSLGFSHKDGSNVLLDLKDGKEKLAKVIIGEKGNIGVGYMEKGNFIGESLDNVVDINEFLGVEQNIDEDMELNNPAPAKPKTKPGTKPSEDDPWAPTPTEHPDADPKADDAPAPAKPKTRPGTKPAEDDPWAPTPTEHPDADPKARKKSRFDEDNDVEFE